MQELPLVSCIMPTYNRREFIPHAIRYFIRQDYPNKELIIIDDGTDPVDDLIPENYDISYYRLDQKITLGEKLNLACEYASGPIIAHWDDDDWYAPWRLTYQINELLKNQTSICGINNLLYLDIRSKTGYNYIYPSNQRTWLLGSSLCYKKDFWKTHHFAHINVGMDGLFVWSTTSEHITVLPDPTFSVHIIHNDNISPKITSGTWWHPCPVEKIKGLLNDDWKYYQNGKIISNIDIKAPIVNFKSSYSYKKENTRQLKNIFACLVHENEDCVIDLVRNLHYHDPTSVIILYNGSEIQNLIQKDFPYEKFNTRIHPSPTPQKHGYLHNFALECMEYALENILFDTLTIVDSDQLAIRSGYTEFLSNYFAETYNVGMLSCNPERILQNNKINHVAAQAFKEYNLWIPLLKQFPDGENKFVHWTFWPSTVFTFNAAKDLVNLFKKNKTLKEIMRITKIWATEEVILPTLVRLLGYDIKENPCSFNYVKYRKQFTKQDIENAYTIDEVFWVHPVAREYENENRQLIRERCNGYIKNGKEVNWEKIQSTFLIYKTDLINKIRKIPGWLSDKEAELLIETTLMSLHRCPQYNNIVEIGSYYGKSTIIFGTVLKKSQIPGKVYAIDLHDGKLGAVDQGLKTYPPSLAGFKKNIIDTKLGEFIEIIIDKATNVKWKNPVSLLFIDGLHDYPNVVADFNHFDGFLIPDSYIAFHDYADYFPGVKKWVNELLSTGFYKKIGQMDSLIVIKKK